MDSQKASSAIQTPSWTMSTRRMGMAHCRGHPLKKSRETLCGVISKGLRVNEGWGGVDTLSLITASPLSQGSCKEPALAGQGQEETTCKFQLQLR